MSSHMLDIATNVASKAEAELSKLRAKYAAEFAATMQSDWAAYTQALALRATTNTLTPMEQELLRLHARRL
jgi:hypothetical protein